MNTPAKSNGRITFVLIVTGILALAVGIRFFGLTREAFWIDEVITFNLSGFPGLATLKSIADGIHPPLYFLGLAQWRAVFGHSEFAIRAFSVVWSAIGIGAILFFAREVGGNRRTVLWAAVLTAISPLSIYFAQEARMYAQASALVALSSWALLEWIKGSFEARRTVLWAVLYTISVAALLMTHHVAVVVALAQGMAATVVALIRRNRRFLIGYLASAVGVWLLFLPWLRYVHSLRSSLYRAADLAWIPSPGWRDVFFLLTRDLVWGSPGWEAAAWIIAQGVSIVLIAAVLWGLWSGRPGGSDTSSFFFLPPEQAFAIWMVIGPVLIALVVSWLYHPVLWYPRFCTLILPPAIVLAACAIDRIRGHAGAAALPAVLVTAALVGLVFQHLALTKGGMRNFAEFWRTEGPPDVIYFFPEWQRTLVRYQVGGSLPLNHRQRFERRFESGEAFTLWVCSIDNYASIWRPDWERTERNWILSLGPQDLLGVIDRSEIVEVNVPSRNK